MMSKKFNINTFKLGIIIISIFLIIAIFAPYIAPYDPFEMHREFETPSLNHYLGTNDIGNDIFSELVYGTRVSLLIGIVAAVLITCIGTIIGMVAGYFGGFMDNIINGIINILMAVPTLPLTLLLIAYLKPGKASLILAMVITSWTFTAKIVRTKTKEIVSQPFIKIEKTLGVSNFTIIFKHIFPNLIDIVLMRGSLTIASCMMAESGLSFLGLGTFGEKSWGSILRYAFFRNSILKQQVWWYLPPIICISLAVMGFILLGYYGVNNEK